MLAIQTANLSKKYAAGIWRRPKRPALDRLTVRVEPGEVFGLLGPNGAGKTTMLKLLLRLIFPTSGRAWILGRPLDDTDMHARVGYLPENPSFYDHLTAEEFLSYACDLFGLSKRLKRERVGSLIDRVGLRESRTVALRKFSKGMIQRLGIAQALVNNPEVLFLDEPMSGLDPLGRREVHDLILELKREGKTIFFSTHILSDAEALCDRVAILDRGRLQGEGDLRKILAMEVSATELVIESSPAQALRLLSSHAESIVRTGGRVRFVLPGSSDVNQVIAEALAAGVRIVSVNPLKISLEEYFFSEVAAQGSRSEARQGPDSERS